MENKDERILEKIWCLGESYKCICSFKETIQICNSKGSKKEQLNNPEIHPRWTSKICQEKCRGIHFFQRPVVKSGERVSKQKTIHRGKCRRKSNRGRKARSKVRFSYE
jgi:hypothetical protein